MANSIVNILDKIWETGREEINIDEKFISHYDNSSNFESIHISRFSKSIAQKYHCLDEINKILQTLFEEKDFRIPDKNIFSGILIKFDECPMILLKNDSYADSEKFYLIYNVVEYRNQMNLKIKNIVDLNINNYFEEKKSFCLIL